MPYLCLLADASPDAATTALGGYGAIANLTCLAFVLLLAGYESLVAKPKREDKQQAHMERLAAEFRAETREQRQMQQQLISDMRSDATRSADKHSEALVQLASAVQSLRMDLRSHGQKEA
jgi:hypothetical protein